MAHENNLPATGFIRLKDTLGPHGPIPLSRSAWYAGVKEGRFPKPVKLGLRAVGYNVDDIRALLAQFDSQNTEEGKS
jgi:prophage regulatory protein